MARHQESGEAGAGNPPSQLVAALLHLLGLAAALSAALAIAVAPVSPTGELPGGEHPMPGIEDITASVGIGGAVVTLLLFVAVLGLALATRREANDVPPPFRRFAGGMTAWLTGAVGFFLGIGLTAGLSLTVQGLLNRLQGSPSVSAPRVLQRVSFTWGVTAVVMLVLLALAGWQLWRRRAAFLRAAERAYTFGPPGPASSRPRLHPTWLRRVARAMRLARLKNHLEPIFWTFGLVGAVLGLAAATDYIVERLTEGASNPFLSGVDLLTGVSSPAGAPIVGDDIVIGIGQLTLLGLAGGAVLLTRGAIQAEGPRRALNVVWDVIAFWPRAVHPFVPPPYSQEVVPALVRRICWHLGEPDPLPDTGEPGSDDDPVPHPSAQDANPHPVREVVVAAHSQGSLISLAALLRLPRELRGRVRWLTFGSQLRQQFPRAFPHYVRVADLREDAGPPRLAEPLPGHRSDRRPGDELGPRLRRPGTPGVRPSRRDDGATGRRRPDHRPAHLRPRVAPAGPAGVGLALPDQRGRRHPRPLRLLARPGVGRGAPDGPGPAPGAARTAAATASGDVAGGGRSRRSRPDEQRHRQAGEQRVRRRCRRRRRPPARR